MPELNLPKAEPYVVAAGGSALTPIFQPDSIEPPPLLSLAGFGAVPGANNAVGTFLGCPFGARVLVTPDFPTAAEGSAPGASALLMSAICGLGGWEFALPMPELAFLTAAKGSGLLWLNKEDRPKEARRELGVDDRKFVSLQAYKSLAFHTVAAVNLAAICT